MIHIAIAYLHGAIDRQVDALHSTVIQREIICGFGRAEGEDALIYGIYKGVTRAEVGHVSFLSLLAEPLAMR
ncbi:hypothetical protein [Streptomyces sp. NPDC005407]|uniref:hypothetical protein n=1 Tax=Streptomyces sp. NPDC005407 TaxID=3155340 RepID=UPI0033BCAE1D